tara:strand:+ start:465 stop:2615 length:2151 start_codon:yes stop_codon:yes gene_type:complete
MALKDTLGYNPYKDLKTSDYSNIEFTFENASKEFQEWFKKNYPGQDYDSFYSEEKRRIRNLFDTVQKQAANKLLRAKKFTPIIKDLDEFNQLGFYPRNYFSKGKAGLTSARLYQLFGDRLKDIEPIDAKYFKAAKKYAAAPLEKKQEFGYKTKLLNESGIKKNKSTFTTFKSALQRIGIFENEIIPEGQNLVGNRRTRDIKITNPNIEAALGGQDLSAGIKVPGKKGSYIHLMHLADRSGPTLINELAYGPGDLNTLLANKNSGAEKFRTSLSKHMDKIAKNYKGKEFYNINSSKRSIDQTRFKEALELKFGTSKGKIPLKAYIDTILNEEARLMGIATDGLITMRPLDPITLERMNPAFSTRGMGTDTTTTILDVAAEKQAAGKGKFGAKTADLNLTANLAFNEVKNNLKTKDIQPIIDNIAAAMKGGLQNQTYEDIMALASQCSKLKTSGVYKFGGRVKLASGGSPCSNVVEAVKQLPDQEFKNLATNTPIATKVLNFLKSPGAKTFGAGAAVGTAVGLVKLFKNDDPTTYLSNEDQQKNMLVDMATQPVSIDIERPAILDYQLPALGATVAASTAAVAPSTIRASRSTKQFASRAEGIERKKPTGPVKTGLRVLGRGLGVAASPALLAPFAAGDIASQIAAGDSPTDIATNPFNYLYPAFADQTPKLTRGLPSAFRKVARLGLSRPALTALSRLGIGGFAASAAIQGLGLLDD